jgi:HlyD family secretion protein
MDQRRLIEAMPVRAPIAGVVTKIEKQAGEFIAASEPLLHLLSPNYEILVDVPETDVAKLLTSTTTMAEFTVDAFGDEARFKARVLSVEKKSTEIQDVVYYQVRLSVELGLEARPFKAGMTVNVTIETDRRENALVIPRRAVKTKPGGKFVSVLQGKTEAEKTVQLGLIGSAGMVEVQAGLEEGELVVVGKRERK